MGELHLFFNYNGDLGVDADVKTHILQLWSGLAKRTKKCFQSIRFISSRLSGIDDLYPTGPCLQFIQTFRSLKQTNLDHFLQYEPDVIPVQPGWGTRLLELALDNSNCREWWQLGSSPMYLNIVDMLIVEGNKGMDMHLNGNSIYCLASRDFDNFRAEVSRSFPPHGCYFNDVHDDLAGYDHVMYRFRLRPENGEYARQINSKFKNDAYIRNFGESPFDPEKLLEMNPRTMLVHSKFSFVDDKQKIILLQKYRIHDLSSAVETIYSDTVGRLPTVSEDDFFQRIFQPFYYDVDVMRCLFIKLTTQCKDFAAKLSGKASKSCGDVKLSDIFPSELEAIITGLYISSFSAMPGPELLYFLQLTRESSEEFIIQGICGAQRTYSSGQGKLIDIMGVTSSGQDIHELFSSVALNILMIPARNMSGANRLGQSASFNQVISGSFILSCEYTGYIRDSDTLFCRHGTSETYLQHPFRCAEDISIDANLKLVC